MPIEILAMLLGMCAAAMLVLIIISIADGDDLSTQIAIVFVIAASLVAWGRAASSERKLEEVGVYNVTTIVQDNREFKFVLVTNARYVEKPEIFGVDIATEKAVVTTYTTRKYGIRFGFKPTIEPYVEGE